MIIKISNLSNGEYYYTFDKKIEEIELSEPFIGNILVEAKLQKSKRQIVLNADIKAKVIFECDRCDEKFEKELINDYKIVYYFSSEINDEEQIDIKYISINTDKIDLSNEVRDYAQLAVPMKKLCKEDCKGLCVTCGKNLNNEDCKCIKEKVDPRWLPLEKLKKNIN